MIPFKAACIQVNAGEDMDDNILAAADLVCQARAAGADFALLPENVAMMTWGRDNIMARAMPQAKHKALSAFRDLARDTGIWLHCGSLAVLTDDGRVANRSFLLDPEGAVVASYDKIHMFDVDLGGGETYCESATFQPGTAAVIAGTPWGKLGFSICYDLRFPHLYRDLAKAGADFLVVPAAFTRTTGRAHWHVLLRARAIETGCYVLAAAQCGEHAGNRQTFGHALIVSPWGAVLGDAGESPGYIMARIDPYDVAEARRKVPALTHDRPYQDPV